MMGEVFNQASEEYTPGIFSLLNRKSVDGAVRNVTGKTGLGKLGRFDDGDDLPSRRRYKTYTTRIEVNNYGAFIDVTKNSIVDRDEQFRADLDEMRDLTIAANYSMDQAGVQLFNGGFATSVDVNGYRMTWYGDGKPLFSTIHPTVVPGGSTQSNASSTGILFTHDNLETARVALVLQQTDDGLALTMTGKPMLVLPENLQKEGLEITASQLKPDTANNAINVFSNGMGVDMTTSALFDSVNGGSNTAWFLCVPGRHKLNHEERQALTLEQDTNIKNKVVTFTVDARWANSVTDWRRTWGSKGDGAAYSS